MSRSSNNCAYVRLGQIVGADNVADLATDLGMTSLDPDAGSWPSLPLSVSEIAIEELTAAVYAALAADGLRVTPRFVDRIVSPDGAMVVPPELPRRRVLQPRTTRLLNQVLISVVESGTGVRARIDGHTVAGKTGTTSTFADAWFVGYTPALATSVWIGDVDKSRAIELPGWGTVFGGETPAEIWRLYMTEALAGVEPEAFDPAPPPLDREPRLLEVDPVVEAPLD